MIHYHGTPITPNEAALAVLSGRHALISYPRPDQLSIAMMVCQSFCLDNGAFSLWKKKKDPDWPGYYAWVDEIRRHPAFDWAIIPDVIDGSESANDELIAEWPLPIHVGVPVFHLHESLDRLERLCRAWPRIAIGSSGQYRTPGSDKWRYRMDELREVAADSLGRPVEGVKIHLLRGLNPAFFTKLPVASADSVTVGVNIGMDCKWPEIYHVSSKAVRGIAYAARIEAHQSSPIWETLSRRARQDQEQQLLIHSLFEREAS